MAKWNFWKQLKELLGGQTAAPVSTSPTQEAETREAETTPTQEASLQEAAPRAHADTAGRQIKSTLLSFVKPTLYFSGWGYDERDGPKYWLQEGKEVLRIEAGKQAYVVRRWSGDVIFREQGDADERAALFVTRARSQGWNRLLANTPLLEFAEAVTQWEYGRCVLYVADFMNPEQCAYLCFAPDGNGFARDEHQIQMATFDWREATAQPWAELLTSDPEHLRPLCKLLFDTQINSRCANPYIDPASLEEIPHRFLKGSEAELRRLTAAIVQTEPKLFEDSLEPVTVTYRAQTPGKRAGMARVVQGKNSVICGRITSLCDLALRLNTFVGVTWKPCADITGKPYRANPNRLGHFNKQIHKVRVVVPPPSAHERAESLLVLADWLEGKVREPKRLRLLGIEE